MSYKTKRSGWNTVNVITNFLNSVCFLNSDCEFLRNNAVFCLNVSVCYFMQKIYNPCKCKELCGWITLWPPNHKSISICNWHLSCTLIKTVSIEVPEKQMNCVETQSAHNKTKTRIKTDKIRGRKIPPDFKFKMHIRQVEWIWLHLTGSEILKTTWWNQCIVIECYKMLPVL